MDKGQAVSIFWFRRDLRLEDNAGLYHALKTGKPVLAGFIFDIEILKQLQDHDDARVTFIYDTIVGIDKDLNQHGSSLLVLHDKPEHAWAQLIKDYQVESVYTNHDYEPYAKDRDDAIANLLRKQGISFNTFKDQVIFDRNEVTK